MGSSEQVQIDFFNHIPNQIFEILSQMGLKRGFSRDLPKYRKIQDSDREKNRGQSRNNARPHPQSYKSPEMLSNL